MISTEYYCVLTVCCLETFSAKIFVSIVIFLLLILGMNDFARGVITLFYLCVGTKSIKTRFRLGVYIRFFYSCDNI
jgi:hypothetical protein